MKRQSYAYAAQEIREAIQQRKINVKALDEDRIQPSSFEPTIGNEAFIVDSEYSGLFRISKNETVYENLLKVPSRQRERVDITAGFELKKGFSYLIPLNEKVTLDQDMMLRSSPKSSLGRLFINTRLIGDYNPSFDELNSLYAEGKEISLWLFVQPLAFNVIIYPGLSLNQIRLIKGYEAQLTPREILDVVEKHPLLYTVDPEGNRFQSEHIVTDGLTLHLNLVGSNTHGVVGLRARHNPNPIDLKKVGYYQVEDFFETIMKQKTVNIKRGEYYLLSSKELLDIPNYINCDLQDHSKVGFLGPLHFAGFTDNGFTGDLVYEIRSDELSKEVELTHNMPLSKLSFFWTNLPEKIYGEANNNYQGQVGTKPAKYFAQIDYKYLARKYESLNREVMTVDRNYLLKHRTLDSGLEMLSEESQKFLFSELNSANFQSRYLCESDDLSLQVVVYLLIQDHDGKYLVYKKPNSIEQYPEKRLFNKSSIGVGIHLTEADYNGSQTMEEMVKNSIVRISRENKLLSETKDLSLDFVGTIISDEDEVDRSHFGLVYRLHIENSGLHLTDDSPLIHSEFATIDSLKTMERDFESWSKVLVGEILA